MYNRLIKKLLRGMCLVAALGGAGGAAAQDGADALLGKLKLEARADAEADVADEMAYGFHGRYFNLAAAGHLGGRFNYCFRQRLQADGGSIHFFDNTDFLYLDWRLSPRWRLRLGKDALAVGGYEYDAPPIDEYLTSEYWNHIYCFQLGGGISYTTGDGRQTFTLQASQSPYTNALGLGWDAGLMAYNVQWAGRIGRHVRTLWSTGMVERWRDGGDGTYMNLTMLGTRVDGGRWGAYLDLMHHALSWDDWGRNYGWVARVDWRCSPSVSLFLKGSHEKNDSRVERQSAAWVDRLVPAGHSYRKGGIGAEWHPGGLESVRVHGYVALLADQASGSRPDYSLVANAGITWTLDFLKAIKKPGAPTP